MSIGRIIGLAFIAALLVLVVTRSLQGEMGYALFEIKNVAADRQKVDLTRLQLEERLADMQAEIAEIEANESKTRVEKDAEIEAIEKVITRLTERDTAFSLPRTIGLWIGAFGTIAILSFLWRDNPLYRVAEHLFVGCSAAYIMVVTFYDSYILHGVQTLFPRLIKNVFSPELDLDPIVERLALRSWLSGVINYEDAVGRALAASWYQLMDVWFWIPTILGIMLLWRLAPKGQWIARWPLAFLFGAFMGVRLIGHLEADFVAQIDAAVQPLVIVDYTLPAPPEGAAAAEAADADTPAPTDVAADPDSPPPVAADPEAPADARAPPDETAPAAADAAALAGTPQVDWGSSFYSTFTSAVLLLGTLCVLVYFFFSVEHRGVVGGVARVGIWVLMITFGAGFGYTVMGRIALLVMRFQFLVRDWLYIESLDPYLNAIFGGGAG